MNTAQSIGRGPCEECDNNDAVLYRSIPDDLNSATICAICLTTPTD
jgi:hypothetical protein